MSKQASKYARSIGVPWHKVARVYTISDDDPRIAELLEDLKSHCPAPEEEHIHIAKARLLSLLHQEESKTVKAVKSKHHTILHYLQVGLLIAVILFLATTKAHCQFVNVNIMSAQGDRTVFDSGNHAFKVNCVTGCSAAGSFTDNTAFTVGTTSVTNIGAYFTSGAAPSITTGNAGRLTMDSSSRLFVNCGAGCGSSSFADLGAFTTGTTSINVDGALFDDTPPTAVATGKAAAFRITNNRALHINVRNQAGTEMGTSSNPFQVTLANTGANTNKLLVTADPITFASAQPVSQNGTWTVQPGNTANTTAWLVTGTGGTFPVTGTIAATQSGNWTSRIVGNAGGIIDAAGQNAASPANEILTACQFNTSPTTITTTNVSPLQCDSGGKLLVNTGTVTVTGTVAATESGTWTVQPGNTANSTAWLVTGTGGTFPATESGTWTVQPGNTANTTPWLVTARIVGNTGATLDAVVGAGTAPTNMVVVGGIYNSTLPAPTTGQSLAQQFDRNGRQWVTVYPDTNNTSYRASKKFAASSTTDNAVMPGNATNTVLLTKVLVTCNQTTAGQINVELLKRSAADTAGTSAAMTAIPMDANYAAAVSAPLSYTGTGPTVGTAIGDLDNLQIGCMAAATATPNDIFIFHPDKPIVLRGTAQQVAVNVGNAALTGGNITVTFEWEETTTP